MRIPLTSGFELIPEGNYVFKIVKVECDEDFGTLKIFMETNDGKKYTERFQLKDADDSYNEKALGAFSFFAKTALNDFKATDIDPEELVGYFIKGEITHDKVPSKKDPNKTLTFAHLAEKAPATASDFGEEPQEETSAVSDLLKDMPF